MASEVGKTEAAVVEGLQTRDDLDAGGVEGATAACYRVEDHPVDRRPEEGPSLAGQERRPPGRL
jgi:hypothetical protein